MIEIQPNYEALSQAAAEHFARAALAAVGRSGRFLAALSGGGTPRRAYELLGREPFKSRVPWQKVFLFWGDERCLPQQDPRRNEQMVRKALLAHVPVVPSQVFALRCYGHAQPSAADYDALLHSLLPAQGAGLDFAFLGLGEDGHTASLFPGQQAALESSRWAEGIYVEAQRMHRVTLTPALLNRTRTMVFLVHGAAKSAILKKILRGPRDPLQLPAQALRPLEGEPVWLVDEEALAGNDGK